MNGDLQTQTAVLAETVAWNDYKAYCLGWRHHRNFPSQEVFKGDERSAALWRTWQGTRAARFAACQRRHRRT